MAVEIKLFRSPGAAMENDRLIASLRNSHEKLLENVEEMIENMSTQLQHVYFLLI